MKHNDLWHIQLIRLHAYSMIQTVLWVELGITRHHIPALSHTLPFSLSFSKRHEWGRLAEVTSHWSFVSVENIGIWVKKKKKKITNTHARTVTHGLTHMHTHKSSVMYKWSRALTHPESLFFPFIPHSYHIHTHTHSLSFHLAHPPISALKYIMKYDDCWHMGTLCASSAGCPLPLSFASLPAECLELGHKAPWTYTGIVCVSL